MCILTAVVRFIFTLASKTRSSSLDEILEQSVNRRLRESDSPHYTPVEEATPAHDVKTLDGRPPWLLKEINEKYLRGTQKVSRREAVGLLHSNDLGIFPRRLVLLKK